MQSSTISRDKNNLFLNSKGQVDSIDRSFILKHLER